MIFFRQLSPDFTKTILGIISLLMALSVAIPFHEFAHAYAAKKQGDYTGLYIFFTILSIKKENSPICIIIPPP